MYTFCHSTKFNTDFNTVANPLHRHGKWKIRTAQPYTNINRLHFKKWLRTLQVCMYVQSIRTSGNVDIFFSERIAKRVTTTHLYYIAVYMYAWQVISEQKEKKNACKRFSCSPEIALCGHAFLYPLPCCNVCPFFSSQGFIIRLSRVLS